MVSGTLSSAPAVTGMAYSHFTTNTTANLGADTGDTRVFRQSASERISRK